MNERGLQGTINFCQRLYHTIYTRKTAAPINKLECSTMPKSKESNQNTDVIPVYLFTLIYYKNIMTELTLNKEENSAPNNLNLKKE